MFSVIRILAFVLATVSIVIYSMALLLFFYIVAFKYISIKVLINTWALLPVVREHSSVLAATRVSVYTESFFAVIYIVSFVRALIFPSEFTITMSASLEIVSFEGITIDTGICTYAVFFAIFPFSNIFGSFDFSKRASAVP